MNSWMNNITEFCFMLASCAFMLIAFIAAIVVFREVLLNL